MSKLCDRGKKTAIKKFKVYPSAYANAYAVQVCSGLKPDYKGITKKEKNYKPSTEKNEGLKRWFDEKWENVCNNKPCGRDKATLKDYPYCRPTIRVNKNTPKLKSEFTNQELKKLCKEKQSRPLKRMEIQKK